MCTIILLYKQFKEFPIFIAQNRDTAKDRIEIPPSIIRYNPIIVSPIDVKSKGSWMGMNEHGLVVALTNGYQPDRKYFKATRSRGLLVLDILKKSKNAKTAINLITELIISYKFKYFNIFILSKTEGFLINYNKELKITKLNKGLYFHYSSGYDSGIVKEKRIKRLQHLFSDFEISHPKEAISKLMTCTKDHFDIENPSRYSICMHGKKRSTASSTIFALNRHGVKKSICLYLHGQPCIEKFKDFSDKLGRSVY